MGQKQSSVRIQHRSFDQPNVDIVDSLNSSLNDALNSSATTNSSSNGFQTVNQEPFKRRLSLRSLRRSFHLPKKRSSHSRLNNKISSTTDDLPNVNNIPAPNLVPLPSKASNGYALVAQGEANSSSSVVSSNTVSRNSDGFVMNRLRASLRASFRSKKKEHVPESLKPHQWQSDEVAVKNGTCQFAVKYLGCIEVFDSRGISICEDAMRQLRNSRKRPVKAFLYVTGDGLRVVEDETRGLIVDQTIEKVSFCAPDRGHERGFSYICRDGTTRRWMCHGFLSSKDCGERLSHAVGCAFAVCLERKQKRDKDALNSIQHDSWDSFSSTTTGAVINTNFVRNGSFRQTSLIERIHDPQVVKTSEPVPFKPIHNPNARERPHPTASLLQRQGSLRGGPLNRISPFKRQLSLRLGMNGLPFQSRDRSQSLQNSEMHLPQSSIVSFDSSKLVQTPNVTSIVEVSPSSESVALLNGSVPNPFEISQEPFILPDSSSKITNDFEITDMCKEITNELKMLSDNHSINIDQTKPCSSSSDSKRSSNSSTPKSAGNATTNILEDPFDSAWVSSFIFDPPSNEFSLEFFSDKEARKSTFKNNYSLSSSQVQFQSLSLVNDNVGSTNVNSTNPFVDSLSQTLQIPNHISSSSSSTSTSTSSSTSSSTSTSTSTSISILPINSKPQQMVTAFEVNL